jgi:tetratricopeptide (TPR) repeat protein
MNRVPPQRLAEVQFVSKRFSIILGILAILVFGVLGFLLWRNSAQQHSTEQRLAELQRQINTAIHAGSQPAGLPAVPEIPTATTLTASQNLELLQTQRNVRTVIDEGWNLINQRNPKAAAQAVAIFREGLEKVDAKNAQFYNGLGRALLIASQPREAIAAWQQGLTLEPGISDMQSGIGWAYWNLHDPYHAREAWEQALALNPKSLDAWSAMVWIYLALGDADKSKAGFQVLYQSDHQNKDWILGLQMAQAKNSDPAQIAKFFPLPPLAAFSAPPAATNTSTTGAPTSRP